MDKMQLVYETAFTLSQYCQKSYLAALRRGCDGDDAAYDRRAAHKAAAERLTAVAGQIGNVLSARAYASSLEAEAEEYHYAPIVREDRLARVAGYRRNEAAAVLKPRLRHGLPFLMEQGRSLNIESEAGSCR